MGTPCSAGGDVPMKPSKGMGRRKPTKGKMTPPTSRPKTKGGKKSRK